MICIKCGHLAHGPLCYNQQSDNDCNCTWNSFADPPGYPKKTKKLYVAINKMIALEPVSQFAVQILGLDLTGVTGICLVFQDEEAAYRELGREAILLPVEVEEATTG